MFLKKKVCDFLYMGTKTDPIRLGCCIFCIHAFFKCYENLRKLRITMNSYSVKIMYTHTLPTMNVFHSMAGKAELWERQTKAHKSTWV